EEPGPDEAAATVPMSQTATSAAPDVRQLGQQELPEAPFPGGRNQPFRVFFKPEAHEGVWKHAAESASVEICGVLVGKWARDADGPFVLVGDHIRASTAAGGEEAPADGQGPAAEPGPARAPEEGFLSPTVTLGLTGVLLFSLGFFIAGFVIKSNLAELRRLGEEERQRIGD